MRKKSSKLSRLKSKLRELQACKQLLLQEGILPDAEDKARESHLIRQILQLEKQAELRDQQAKKDAAKPTRQRLPQNYQEAYATPGEILDRVKGHKKQKSFSWRG